MIISFGKLNKYSLLFFFVPFFIGLRWLLEANFKIENKNLFFNSFINFFSSFLNFINWILLNINLSPDDEGNKAKNNNAKTKLLSKNESDDSKIKVKEMKKKEKEENQEDDKERLYRSSSLSFLSSQRKRQKIKRAQILKRIELQSNFILILAGFIYFVVVFASNILYALKSYGKDFSGGIVILSAYVRLIIFAILTHIFIKYAKIYRHHYTSMIVLAIIIIMFFITSFIFEIGFSFIYAIGLIYLFKTNGNIYKLLFFKGLIGIILSFLVQLPLSFYECKKSDYFLDNFKYCDDNGKYILIFENFKSFEKFGGFLTIGIIISNCLENICIYLLIYYFSLNHYGALFAIPIYARFLLDNYSLGLKIAYFIGGIIILFATLTYTEIIILNFWGLERNTKSEISKRANSETEIETTETDKDKDKREQEEDEAEYKNEISLQNIKS